MQNWMKRTHVLEVSIAMTLGGWGGWKGHEGSSAGAGGGAAGNVLF